MPFDWADPFDLDSQLTEDERQVRDTARFFGVDSRTADGLVNHTLMTAVIAADGRIARLLPSNDWRPDDLFEVVRRTAIH